MLSWLRPYKKYCFLHYLIALYIFNYIISNNIFSCDMKLFGLESGIKVTENETEMLTSLINIPLQTQA